MNTLAVCHSDIKSQVTALKKCKFEKCKWCYPNMQPYVHNTHIFGGKICKDFYHRTISQNGGILFFILCSQENKTLKLCFKISYKLY